MSSSKKLSKEKYNIKPIEEKKSISYEDFQKEILLEKISSKDRQIYDLLSKIKTQESKILILNKELEEKDLNIYTLEQNYKIQKEEFKNIFGFKGDLELLLNKKENSYEYEFAKFMNQTQKDIIVNDNKIIKLKEEIKQLERENEQLNICIEIKRNNETMIEILKSIEKNKKIKNDDIQSKIDEEIMNKNLNKKNKYLRKKIDEIKKNLNTGSNIVKNMAQSVVIRTNNNVNNNKIKTNIEIDNKEMENRIEKLKEKENKEIQILLNKYLSIIEQKKKNIIKGDEYLNNIDKIYCQEIKKYEEELFQLFKFIKKIINIYYKSFDKPYSVILRKEDCDKLLEKELNNFNILSFPLLFKFKELKERNNYEKNANKQSIKLLEDELILTKINNKANYNINEDNQKIESLNFVNVGSSGGLDYSYEQILTEKQSLFSTIERKKEEQLNNLSKEQLLTYVLEFSSFIEEYDKFINKYINSKNQKKFIKFLDIPRNNIKNIEQKIYDINNKIKELNIKQNQMDLVLEVSSQKINKIKNENLKLSSMIKTSKSNNKKLKVLNLYHDDNYFKKSLTNRNSIKNGLAIKNESHTNLTHRRYIKEKNKIFKIKVK